MAKRSAFLVSWTLGPRRQHLRLLVPAGQTRDRNVIDGVCERWRLVRRTRESAMQNLAPAWGAGQ